MEKKQYNIPISFQFVGFRHLRHLGILMYFNTLRFLDPGCRIHKTKYNGYMSFISFLFLLVCAFVTGCTNYKGEEFQSNDIPPGKGLFTGEAGEYTLYQK